MRIVGYSKGALTISAIKAVRIHTKMSLLESKRLIEKVLAGEDVFIADDVKLKEELIGFGFAIK